jgi:hypothetical protein
VEPEPPCFEVGLFLGRAVHAEEVYEATVASPVEILYRLAGWWVRDGYDTGSIHLNELDTYIVDYGREKKVRM